MKYESLPFQKPAFPVFFSLSKLPFLHFPTLLYKRLIPHVCSPIVETFLRDLTNQSFTWTGQNSPRKMIKQQNSFNSIKCKSTHWYSFHGTWFEVLNLSRIHNNATRSQGTNFQVYFCLYFCLCLRLLSVCAFFLNLYLWCWQDGGFHLWGREVWRQPFWRWRVCKCSCQSQKDRRS